MDEEEKPEAEEQIKALVRVVELPEPEPKEEE